MSEQLQDPPSKPIPLPNPDTVAYWDGLREGRLMLQQCAQCGHIRHYPRPMCDECYSMESKWVQASGKGKVHSWTETHHPFHPGFKQELPYVLVTVELEEGVRLNAQLRGAGLADLALDKPVRIQFESAGPELVLPVATLDT
ncbi:MAG: Zn-ribbon domain-containing OB-fold protein [Gammaproteobacteria bacterium]|nr:Zn-ribbon domain-containing OB-fold protein [Gammaproteobacteria bacterium]